MGIIQSEHSKGAVQGRNTDNLPLGDSTGLRTQNQDAGGGLALALALRPAPPDSCLELGERVGAIPLPLPRRNTLS